MIFDTEQVNKRQGRDGMTGICYSKKPTATVPPNKTMMARAPDVDTDKITKVTNTTKANRFREEVVERQRFIDGKPSLAGKRNVSEFEDRQQLRFDPVEQYNKNKSGHSTYDSGRHQSGTRGDQAFMKGGTNLPEGRGKFTSLERQDPYLLKLPAAIKIRQ